jgi:hypothetical protein
MDYEGRPQAERGPHQVAAAMAHVLERYTQALAAEGRAHAHFDVREHPKLEQALHQLGQAVFEAGTPTPELQTPTRFGSEAGANHANGNYVGRR